MKQPSFPAPSSPILYSYCSVNLHHAHPALSIFITLIPSTCRGLVHDARLIPGVGHTKARSRLTKRYTSLYDIAIAMMSIAIVNAVNTMRLKGTLFSS